MNLQRPRWVLRTGDGKILIGQRQQYQFRNLEDVKDARVATYMSEKKALNAVNSQGWDVDRLGIYAEQVWESYISF